MAITVLKKTGNELYLKGSGSSGAGGWGFGTIVGPSSYATGGFAADVATDFGLATEPDIVIVTVAQATSTRAYDAVWDSAAKKIVGYTAGTVTEIANTTDIDAYTFHVVYFTNEA